MSAKVSPAARGMTTWLRPLAVVVISLGLAAEGGRVLLESARQCMAYAKGPIFERFGSPTGLPLVDPFFCALLGFFREILIYPVGRAVGLLFFSFALPFLLNLFWRARTRSQVFRAFLFAAVGQIITLGLASALFYSSTHVPSVRDPAKSSKDYAYLVKRARPSISSKYVLWIILVLLLASPPFVALLLTPTENDSVYILANGAFQLFPLGFLLALLVSPLKSNTSANGHSTSFKERAAGVRLVRSLFHLISWLSMLLWWAGVIALFVKPAITNEETHGNHTEVVSPIMASFLAGKWEWFVPDLSEMKGGPLFFIADLLSSILAAWSAQIESGQTPSVAQAIVFGPPFAIARSMAKTWGDAIDL